MSYRLTHYTLRDVQPDRWIQLGILTRLANALEGPFFVGFQKSFTLTAEEVREREQHGAVIRMRHPKPIAADQALWLTPEGDLWLARLHDPLNDSRRRYVDHLRRSGIHAPNLWDPISKSDFFRSSHVARQIAALNAICVYYGDYLNSKRRPGQRYIPRWQSDMLANMLSDFRRAMGVNIGPRVVGWQEHIYSQLADKIMKGKIALPFEVILFTQRRKCFVDGIHLMTVRSLAVVYVDGGLAERELGYLADAECATTSVTWLARLRESGVSVCAHADTAAGEFMLEAIYEGELIEDRFKLRTTIAELVTWLRDDGRRVVVCDVGAAHQVITNARSQDLSLSLSVVPYKEPIPAGIAFPLDDPHWGALLERAFEQTWRSTDPAVRSSFDETIGLCSDIAAEWVYGRPDTQTADTDEVGANEL